ncbi:manganese superoxide dismutase [Candidatus Blochmanniella floridana]|uniref:Superoxide dismutase n=1 Tax=Blochmanniella floridana TaxID=203907 RepID=Q7VQU3_BLOFL|nr:manganese superoxide dismutase [Candidatus Blochmannia floridanus]
MNFVLPKLSYSYDSLEPFFDEKTMRIHHTKHHQTYIDNTNSALSTLQEFSHLSIEELMQNLNSIPKEKRNLLRNNGGGHINHSLFWKSLKYGTILQGSLKRKIENAFSSVDNFKKKFETTAMSRFGSGWIWLIQHNDDLKIISTANQDNPLMKLDYLYEENNTNIHLLLGLDVWEHAYYLQYQNRRLDYVQAFWNIVDWNEVSNRLC